MTTYWRLRCVCDAIHKLLAGSPRRLHSLVLSSLNKSIRTKPHSAFSSLSSKDIDLCIRGACTFQWPALRCENNCKPSPHTSNIFQLLIDSVVSRKIHSHKFDQFSHMCTHENFPESEHHSKTVRAALQSATTKLRRQKPLASKGTEARCMLMSLGAAHVVF